MSSDGAHLGINAERAMEIIVGAAAQRESPAAVRESPAAVRERIMAAAARGGEPTGYGDCADMVAGMVLAFYGPRPEAVTWPAESAGGGA